MPLGGGYGSFQTPRYYLKMSLCTVLCVFFSMIIICSWRVPVFSLREKNAHVHCRMSISLWRRIQVKDSKHPSWLALSTSGSMTWQWEQPAVSIGSRVNICSVPGKSRETRSWGVSQRPSWAATRCRRHRGESKCFSSGPN